MAYIVTGHTGEPHVTAADVGAFQLGICGPDDYVLSGSNKLEFESIGNGSYKIKAPCEIVMNGRHARLEGNEQVTIESTLAGRYRKDYVVARYSINSEGIESVNIAVVEGTPADSEGAASYPELEKTDLYTASGTREMALLAVTVNGNDVIDSRVVPLHLLDQAGIVRLVEEHVPNTGEIVELVLDNSVELPSDEDSPRRATLGYLKLPKGKWAVDVRLTVSNDGGAEEPAGFECILSCSGILPKRYGYIRRVLGRTNLKSTYNQIVESTFFIDTTNAYIYGDGTARVYVEAGKYGTPRVRVLGSTNESMPYISVVRAMRIA